MRWAVLGSAVVGVLAGMMLAEPSVRAQAPEIPRTPSGRPDLSGYWEYRTTTPLQRPTEFGDKAQLTPEEVAAYLPRRLADIGHERDLQLNADWWQPGELTDGRTSLIVDPADGRLPERTAAALERSRTLGLASRLRPADGPEDRERYERCIMGRTVPLLAVAPPRLVQFFQNEDHLIILHEQKSDIRIIPIDGPSAPADSVRQWSGRSRGRWEGDTLVVETTHLNGAWTLSGSGANMHVVERFARTADGIDLAFTVTDPESFAAPWTVTFPITPAVGPLFENACHEGNYSMPLILRGARAEERKAAGR